jgi:hypothetical protein
MNFSAFWQKQFPVVDPADFSRYPNSNKPETKKSLAHNERQEFFLFFLYGFAREK